MLGAGQLQSTRPCFIHNQFIYDLRLMNSVSKEKTKLMDCHPEIQRERMRQQEEDGFWEGNGHAGKEDVILYIGKDFCCPVKTMPSLQSSQASRFTSHRNFRIV